MDSQVMVGLGEFRFSMSTAAYQSLERENSWRWPSSEVIGFMPQPQYVGPGEAVIRLSGTVYPHFAGAGLGQLDDMRAEADKGEPLKMVDGTGRYWGRWAITSIRETQTVFWSSGAPRCQEFELSAKFVDWGHPFELAAFATRPNDAAG